ncbi:MAG TPA: UDP-N-acetylmuramate dehydrogenase [Mycobacteriales bacterium]|nr:UDP-N-acetylmuramate dehydrogenase [Mycobacteriales bacterium]
MVTRHGVPLAGFTTLRIGGPAGLLVEATSEAELVEAVQAHPDALVLGGGSNVVLPDDGVPEVVLVRSRGVTHDGPDVVVQAGEDWDGLVARMLSEGRVGLEAMSGIPGTVGAAPVQNIGAYGSELASSVVSVRVLDRRTGGVEELAAAACGFRYRHSGFKDDPTRWVVLAVRLRLGRGTASAPVRYAELARALGVGLGDPAPAEQVREAVLALRRGKGMVLDPQDPDSVSAGSFFTNPIVEAAPEGAPSWPDASGGVKVSAAWLIEQAGFTKGWGTGRVGLSSKHTLALVNRGGATRAELLGVARSVRDGVRDRFGITLVPEPVVVGPHREDPLSQ